jgi:hypothetical protein
MPEPTRPRPEADPPDRVADRIPPPADREPAPAPGPSPAPLPGPDATPPDPTRPVDPARAADARAVLARRRGLPGPYITGGEDADPTAGRSEERRYGTLLVAMVVAIVLAGFVLGIVGVLLGAGTP